MTTPARSSPRTTGGATWVPASRPAAGGPVTAITSVGTTVLAGTASGKLLRSGNRGASFAEVGSGLPDDRITRSETDDTYASDDTIWVSTWHEGVYRSRDRGATFSRTSTGLRTDPQADEARHRHISATWRSPGCRRRGHACSSPLSRAYSDPTDGADHWREVQTLAEYVVGLAISPDFQTRPAPWSRPPTSRVRTCRPIAATPGRAATSGSGPRAATLRSRVPPDQRPLLAELRQRRHDLHRRGHKVLKSVDRGASWAAQTVEAFPVGTPSSTSSSPSPPYATRPDGLRAREGQSIGHDRAARRLLDPARQRRQQRAVAPREAPLPGQARAVGQHGHRRVEERRRRVELDLYRPVEVPSARRLFELRSRRDGVRRYGARALRDPGPRRPVDRARRVAAVELEPRRGGVGLTELPNRRDGARQCVGEGVVPLV